MTRRMFSVPARWPAWRERPRSFAQRPLPSMMMATCAAVRRSWLRRVLLAVRLLAGSAGGAADDHRGGGLDLHQLGFFFLAALVDLRRCSGRSASAAGPAPCAGRPRRPPCSCTSLRTWSMPSRRTLRTATRPSSTRLWTILIRSLRRCSVSGGMARRIICAVVRGREAEVGLLQRLLDGATARAGPRAGSSAGAASGAATVAIWFTGIMRAEVLDADVVDEADVGVAGADGGQLALRRPRPSSSCGLRCRQ